MVVIVIQTPIVYNRYENSVKVFESKPINPLGYFVSVDELPAPQYLRFLK